MNLYYGIKYNIRGVFLSLKTPKLLMLGLLRFFVVLFFSILFLGAVLYWHEQILGLVWEKPDPGWLIYLWKMVSLILSIILAGVSMVIAYIVSQLFFCVFIMDYMSRITEALVLGRETQPETGSWLFFFIYLIKQEIPRAIIPVIIALIIMLVGLFTPVGPIVFILSSVAAGVFLAWDNTDLTPARRMIPFKTRFMFLKQNLGFHIGFGLLFLIPWLNILFLSFAPVGATLYFIDKENNRLGK